MSRIGVFICHCGENIARTVDTAAVADALRSHPGVAWSEDYKYMCSDPGQQLVRKAIEEHQLTGIVVAACSPHMHEKTFRAACKAAGLNPFMCEMANIREHCSWIHEDRADATAKAIDIARTIIEKVKHNRPLEPIKIPVTKRAMVIGGGIAGIQAALDIADGGHEVILVEKDASIGGHMSQLSETFPTLDCSQCILTPRMVEAYQHPNIKLYTWSEVDKVDGYIGNFEVTIRRKARSVDEDLCNGCGDCQAACPARKIPSEFEAGLGKRTAIYVPFPQAVPNIPVLDRDNCSLFKGRRKGLKKDACGKCKETCLKGAIDYDTEDVFVKEEVGAIVVATGFKLYDIGREQPEGLKGYGEYGYGEVPDVIDGLQFERLASASGPTSGEIRRPSDGKDPRDGRVRALRRLARPGQGHQLLLQDLLHVQRQARDALQAQGARRPRGRLLHGHPRRGQGLRRVQPTRHRRGRRRVHPRTREPHLPRRRQGEGVGLRHAGPASRS